MKFESTKTYLQGMGISVEIMKQIAQFRREMDCESIKAHDHFPVLVDAYEGNRDVLRDCIIAILMGKPLLLEGVKGTGKNTLCNTLATIFQRPVYDFSFNMSTDKGDLLGEKTLTANKGATEVSFQIGDLVRAMEEGAFFIADEINMAHPALLALLHSLTDIRSKIEVPSYGMVRPHSAFRFIGTMNYGYLGTQELNEAFADRHMIIHLEPLTAMEIHKKLKDNHPELLPEVAKQLGLLYHDLHKAALNGEISSRAVSIRGILDLVKCVEMGMPHMMAFQRCLIDKAFEPIEKAKIQDVLKTRFLPSTQFFVNETTSESKIESVVSGVDISGIPERSR